MCTANKKNIKIYVWVGLLSLLFFTSFIIFNKGVVIFFGDSYEQIYMFYVGMWKAIKSGTLSGFYFSLGLGSSIFTIAFYVLFNPFFYLSLLFKIEHIKYFFLLSYWLQFFLTFVTSSLWLKQLVKHRLSWVAGSLMITFCGWSIFYMQYDLFFRAFIFYTLILYFVEKYLTDQKIIGLTLSIGALGITNYFLLYQFIPYLFLYTLARYLIINQTHLTLKQTIIDALKFIGFTLLGIGISAIVLIPAAYVVFSMPRFSQAALNGVAFTNPKQLFNIFSSLLTPAISILDANYFIASNQYSSLGWGGGAPLYALSICLPLVICFFFSKKSFLKIVYTALLAILVIFTLCLNFYTLFNLTIDTRWLYMFVLTFALIATQTCEQLNDNQISITKLKLSLIVTLIVYVATITVSLIFKFNSYENLKVQISIVVILMALLIEHYIAYRQKKFIFNAAFISIEILLCGQILYFNNKPVNYNAFNHPVMKFDVTSYLDQIDTDNDFYRVLYDSVTYIEPIDSNKNVSLVGSNHPLAQNYNGFSFYSSTYNFETEEYINRMKSTWNMTQARGRNYSYGLLGAKYYLTYDFNNEIPFGYEHLKTLENGLSIYQNKYALPFAFTFNQTFNSQELLNYPYYMQDYILANYYVSDSSMNTTYECKMPELLITFADSEYREYWFEQPITNTQLIVENFGIPTLTIQTYYQDQLVKEYPPYWQFNYIDLMIDDQPIDKIVILGADLYGYGTQVNLYALDLQNYIDTFTKLAQNTATDINYTNNSITANITINDTNNYVFTSIPYDIGWDVIVDGNKINYEKVQLGFIGFELPQGKHTLEFKYSIPYLPLGISVSITSLAILAIIAVFKAKQTKQ